MLRYYFALFVLIITTFQSSVFACTRILYSTNAKAILVGRNMDWSLNNMQTHLMVYPRGIMRDGKVATNPLTWVSKYGSVVATAYEAITTDGVNEKNLAAHILWLNESDYGLRDEKIPGLSVMMWMQFYLDNFASVAEAVRFTQTSSLQLAPFFHPITKKWIKLHLALEDAQGDSAIIEYTNGKVQIYHDKRYAVLTNSPTYDLQLKHWYQQKDKALPGTTNSEDRFVRGSFYVNHMPTDSISIKRELSELLSLMDNVAQPFGVDSVERPGVSPTLWKSVIDLTHGVYYFRAEDSLNMIWVELNKFNFRAGAPVMDLAINKYPELTGEVSSYFKPIN